MATRSMLYEILVILGLIALLIVLSLWIGLGAAALIVVVLGVVFAVWERKTGRR